MTEPLKPAKRLLAVVKPKRKIGEMTDAERDAFAAEIVGAAAEAKAVEP
jgi:hypothetical protein